MLFRSFHIERVHEDLFSRKITLEAVFADLTDDDLEDASRNWDAGEWESAPSLGSQRVPLSRRGRFAEYVFISYAREDLSKDTAASLLGCDPDIVDEALASIMPANEFREVL